MYIRELELHDFRNVERATLSFRPGVTVFVGANGQGKTNILESIEYVATGSSHRVSSDVPLVRRGCDSAVVRGSFQAGARDSLVEMRILKDGTNTIRVNKRDSRRRELAGEFPVVLFAPSDLALVKGDPAERRGFLNQLLVTTRPAMASVFAQYERTVKQRNTLLKSARQFRLKDEQLDTLATWDHALAVTGAEIMSARQSLVERIEPLVAETYGRLVDRPSSVQLTIQSSVDDANSAGTIPDSSSYDRFLAAFGRVRTAELERGTTLIGPHRDDLVLILDELPARTHSSHGESWSYALALRLASIQLIRELSMVGDPIVMLDDVFAELDSSRRERLAALVAPYEQVLITAAIGQDIPPALTGSRFAVDAGEVTRDE